MTSGFGIAFEQPHKRVDITYFCLPKTFEAIWNMLEKRHFVKTLPKQEVIYKQFSQYLTIDDCIRAISGDTGRFFRGWKRPQRVHTQDMDESLEEWRQKENKCISDIKRLDRRMITKIVERSK